MEIPLFVVMPNHIHSIVYIDRDIWGMTGGDAMNNGVIGDAMNRVSTGGGITGRYNPMVTNCLGTVIRRLKARVTRLSNQNGIPFG